MKQISVEKGKEYMELIEGICRLIHLSIPELTAVLYDIKPVMADMINFEKFDQNFKNKLNQASQLCKKLGFKMAVSKYKFVINSPRGIFEMVEMSDKRKGKIAIGVSKNIDKALEGVELYYKKMFDSKYGRRFGEVMGYPECCLKFGDYLCNNNDDSDNFGFANPAVESLKRSKDFAWQLNVFTHSLLPHYPCTLTCQESIKYVNNLLSIFNKTNPGLFEMRKSYLKKPASLYWTCADRIFLYGDLDGDFENSEVKYHQTEPAITSSEFYQANDQKYLSGLMRIQKKIEQGNRIIMAKDYYEVYKDKRRLARVKKDDQYMPILVKPNR